jgi:ubiquinone/menaquinone biosynthesis C-methylase UbiE
VADNTEFRPDLYRETADDYDRFRLHYPQSMIDDLRHQAGVTGNGVLLDLACGTGQVAFALAPAFRAVWMVDQEPDMIALVRDKARRAGMARIHPVVADAEAFAPETTFDLVTVGNAFHRLRREVVAGRILRWVAPGGHLALLWSDTPWQGNAEWQTALSTVLDRWQARLGSGRIPAGWEEARRRRPDRLILTAAGFEAVGEHRLSSAHRWTVDDLIGFTYSTSFLPRHVLGASAADFEADLHAALDRFDGGAGLHQVIDFAYELYRRPAITE